MIDFNKLTEEYVKCFQDKSRIYMIQHFLKTFDNTKKKDVPFLLFPRQQDLCRTLGNARNVVTTKPRQAGITTTAGGFIACEIVLADKDSPQTILCIGNTLDLAQQMLTKIRDFSLQFPLWVWGNEYMDLGYDITQPPTNKNIIFTRCNSKELVYKNGCKVVARSSGPDASRGVGGCNWLIFDEAAFIENGNDVYASALPTVSTGGHIIMISTPNGKDKLYYETCRRAALKGTADWNNFELVEMKWYQDPRYNKYLEWYRKNPETGNVDIIKEDIIDNEGSIQYRPEYWEKMISDGYQARSPWYLKMCKQFNNDDQKIAQELDVSFLGSASNVVAPEFIEMQAKLNVREPSTEYKDPFVDETWVWKLPIPGHRYICACLPEGEMVKTTNGSLKIERVTPSHSLINEKGDAEKIIECKRRKVSDETIYKIITTGNARPMKFTGKHPLLVPELLGKYHENLFDYKEASAVKRGMWLSFPNVYYNKELAENELLKIAEQYDFNSEVLSNDFWWFCGLWTACGSCKSRIKITLSINNSNALTRACTIIEGLFKANCRLIPFVNTIELSFSNENLFKFLQRLVVGDNINETVKMLPKSLRKSFLRGYFQSEMNVERRVDSETAIIVKSRSLGILEDLQEILFSIGILPTIRESFSGGSIIRFLSKQKQYELELFGKEASTFQDLVLDEKNTKSKKCNSGIKFSDDYSSIYFKVEAVKTETYTGYVYNFETENHTFCANRCATHNCDASRGDSEDSTAIEILDIDAIDDDGKPCIEQVLEYNGKKCSDEIGEMLYYYGKMYGNAHIVVDCVGGVGDPAVLMLQRLKYENLYYDDPQLKTYTIQRESSSLNIDTNGKMPGFHSSSVRYQMLSYFANMVKTNQLKIRSKRVINELDTWIYKGAARRIDHMDGCHDDTLTCLAMGLFVLNFSINQLEQVKKRDESILQAWVTGNSKKPEPIRQITEINMAPKATMPFFSNTTIEQAASPSIGGNYMWLFAKRR